MKKQQGFGIVQILLVIVLIGMIVGTGYYVWQNRKLDVQTSVNTADPVSDDESGESQFEEIDDGTTENIDYIKFADVDQGLQDIIKKTYANDGPSCQFENTDQDGYVDLDKSIQKYKANNGSMVEIGCDGSSVYVFVFTGQDWKQASSAQTGFSCDDIDKYKVSKDVVAYCVDEDGNDKEVTY